MAPRTRTPAGGERSARPSAGGARRLCPRLVFRSAARGCILRGVWTERKEDAEAARPATGRAWSWSRVLVGAFCWGHETQARPDWSRKRTR